MIISNDYDVDNEDDDADDADAASDCSNKTSICTKY